MKSELLNNIELCIKKLHDINLTSKENSLQVQVLNKNITVLKQNVLNETYDEQRMKYLNDYVLKIRKDIDYI